MKRVSLLVFLMVSLAELGLERYRFYLFCSTAALAGLACNLLMSRRKAQHAAKARVFEKGKGDSGCVSPQQSELAHESLPRSPEDRCENLEPAHSALGALALMHDKST